MFLPEYDAKLHLENEKRISYEEGMKAGLKKAELKGEQREIQRYRKLLEALRKNGREGEFLTAFDDPKRMKALYREFGIR